MINFQRSKHITLNDIYLVVLAVYLHNNYVIAEMDVEPQQDIKLSNRFLLTM
jgi:hypothetical protein